MAGVYDDTAGIERLHTSTVKLEGAQLSIANDEWSWLFQCDALVEHLAAAGVDQWTGRIDEVFPDFDCFAQRCCAHSEFEPSLGRYGRWLNGLVQWDWWDFGGGFNGRITGQVRMPGAARAAVSSGPSALRDALRNIVDCLQKALDQEPPPSFDVRADENVELVATLLADLRAGRPHATPSALVLPPGSVPDAMRWIDSWPHLSPQNAPEALGLAPDATFPDILEAAYARFHDHWAAAIAYHH